MKTPANINTEYSFMLQETTKLYNPVIAGYVNDRLLNRWNILAVEQRAGRCYYGPKIITIPMYAIRKGIEHTTYYLAHEIAHSYTGHAAKHGLIFMRKLIEICPKEYQYLEYEYKPRNALIAGVALNRSDLF